MGNFAKPSITTTDTTSPYLQQWLSNPQSFSNAFGGNNLLAGQAGNMMSNQLAQVGSPEASAYQSALPLLMQMAQRSAPGQQSNPFSEMQFGNTSTQMNDPAGQMNPIGQALQTMTAATPIFSRNLQDANARLATIAPGRFGSGIAQEGRDLNSQALQDFNLFSNQAIQQALGLEQQNRESMRNFGLGARGLQQTAAQNAAGNQLQARGLQQGAEFQNRDQNMQGMNMGNNNILQALALMGQMAGQAGNGQFNRNLQAGQFGLQQQAGAINPILQLLGLAQPTTPVINPSGYDQLLKGLTTGAAVISAVRGGGSGGGGH